MATETKACGQTWQHDNYNTSTVAATKTPTVPANFLLIQNMDSTDNLLFSLDGGTTFKTILPLASLNLDCNRLVSYKIKSSANTPAAECLYLSE